MLNLFGRRRSQHRIKEIIGRISFQTQNFWQNLRTLSGFSTIDETVPDYEFWDKLRRGQAQGYRIAGLFAKPIAEINASWVIGAGVSAELVEGPDEDAAEGDPLLYTNTVIKRFMHRMRRTFLTLLIDLYGLADQYVIVNADGSISIPSPETVNAEYARLDYRKLERVTITTRLDRLVLTDEYRADGRTVKIKTADLTLFTELLAQGWQSSNEPDTVFLEFENLIERLPVVHFANDRGTNETHGRVIYEGLLPLLFRYDGSINKGLDAADLMSNPIPVFEGLEDVDEFLELNAEPTDEMYTDELGEERSRVRIMFDRLATIILGKGGKFSFAGPQSGFTNDLKAMGKWMFLLILDYTRIPEAIWGNELSSARASAQEQLKTFYMHINGRRLALEGDGADDLIEAQAEGGILEVLDIWLRTRRLLDRKIVVAPVRAIWPELGETNDEMNLKWADSMHDKGVIRDRTHVAISGRIDDPDDEVERAREEGDEKAKQNEQSQIDKAVDDAFAAGDETDELEPDAELEEVT